jgi:hypothetical protein
MKRIFKFFIVISLLITGQQRLTAQTITGAWKGKIGNLRTELKIIKKGDSLLGTSYYYTSHNHYRRYSIKGYFDPETNNVIWWDDVLLDEKGSGNMREPFLSVADFNCPGETKMLLEGKSTAVNDKEKQTGPVQLQKVTGSSFADEWDFVIENYTVGANHPDIIDSVYMISFTPEPVIPGNETEISHAIVRTPAPELKQPAKIAPPVNAENKTLAPTGARSIDDKFATRTKKLQTVIPVTGDKVELRFYDNAQIDGDSIALFLNGRMLFKNIRLTDQAYTITLNASELQDDNELVMVAENLGSIPPNTSFMVAIVGNKRYEARLYANENSSALIRVVKN